MGLNTQQPGRGDSLREVLRGVLLAAVRSGPGAADGIGSIECQAVATLYLLLMDHSIDEWGRCRYCRRPGAVFGRRWRRCRVHGQARVWLRQSEELLLRLLADVLGLAAGPSPAAESAPGRAPASDSQDTDVRPAIATDPPTQPLQTPAIPSPLPPGPVERDGRPLHTAGPGSWTCRRAAVGECAVGSVDPGLSQP